MKRKDDIASIFLPTNESRAGELLIEREQQGSEKVEDKYESEEDEVEERVFGFCIS